MTLAEVREACLNSTGLRARWHEHPTRGRRLYVFADTATGVPLYVVLRPLTDDVWLLVTARRVGR